MTAAGREPRRIAVIVTRQIGDVLLTTPLIAAARARWPEAQIDAIGSHGTLGVLAGHPALAGLVDIGRARTLRQRWDVARRLWRRYDLALVAEWSDRAHLLGFVAAPVRAGLVPQTRAHAWWKRRLLRHAVVGETRACHVAAEKVALLDPWRHDTALPPVTAPRAAPLPADFEAMLERRFVVVHVPSMWRYKQWPLEHYRHVVRSLLDDGHQLVLTGGPAAADRAMVAALATLAAAPRLVDACGRVDFAQLAGLLARAALYIGPDTSVTHLAAATGVPVLALFGPTDPVRWGPLGPGAGQAPYLRVATAPQRRGNVVLFQGPETCVPCRRAGCADRHDSASLCLDDIAPARVVAEARRVLGEGVGVGAARSV